MCMFSIQPTYQRIPNSILEDLQSVHLQMICMKANNIYVSINRPFRFVNRPCWFVWFVWFVCLTWVTSYINHHSFLHRGLDGLFLLLHASVVFTLRNVSVHSTSSLPLPLTIFRLIVALFRKHPVLTSLHHVSSVVFRRRGRRGL